MLPKTKICPKALAQMKLRVKDRPWAEIKREEDKLWASRNDCPGLGLVSKNPPKKSRMKEIGEMPAEPLIEVRIH